MRYTYKFDTEEEYNNKLTEWSRDYSRKRVAMCSINNNVLYTEKYYDETLQYLQSTGTQYINLNYFGAGTDIIETKIRSTSASWNYNTAGANLTDYPLWNPIFGMNVSGTYKMWGTYVRHKSNNNYLMYYYNQSGGTVVYPNFTPALSASTVINWYTYKYDRNSVYRNDSKLTLNGGTGTITDTPLTQRSLYLFAVNDRDPIVKTSVLQMEYFKLSDHNGKMIFDLIPVKNNGVGCMFDIVHKQFYENVGTEDFVCGPTK